MHRLARRAAAVLLTFLAVPAASAGQSIAGTVRDAESGAPIVRADVWLVPPAGPPQQLTADSLGRFLFRLPNEGRYRLRATALGYRPAEETDVDVGPRDIVDVVLMMSPTPVELEGIRVLGRRVDPRHLATWDGFLARRETAHTVGPERIVVRTDPEMRGAMRVSDVLQWFPHARGCVVYFLDGIERRGWDFEDMSAAHFEGVEYYRNGAFAPLEYRSLACAGRPYSVIALWSLR
jgi:Carboxypeptidase regulatory-like domain